MIVVLRARRWSSEAQPGISAWISRTRSGSALAVFAACRAPSRSWVSRRRWTARPTRRPPATASRRDVVQLGWALQLRRGTVAPERFGGSAPLTAQTLELQGLDLDSPGDRAEIERVLGAEFCGSSGVGPPRHRGVPPTPRCSIDSTVWPSRAPARSTPSSMPPLPHPDRRSPLPFTEENTDDRSRHHHDDADPLGVADIARLSGEVLERVSTVVVGMRPALELALATILAGGHVLFEDVPGLGKTLAARSIASAIGLEFRRLQCTPDLLPADITGSFVYAPASARRSCSGPVPSSPDCSSRTRSTARRRRPSRRCWRRWRRGR